ncbi:uncharacterized protein (UPF0264 family) [Agrobacterium vitis]|nr:uncharacterized protein (UPF0264 family) [Agrobacterium vitis]MBE1439030.1 uncharacterized protein (UPF0264 family) [Agrobacterium vitis]
MIALFAVGFAHKAPVASASPLSISELAAYTLPDGSLPVLCISDQAVSDHDQDHKHKANGGCEACRISASILLALPTDTASLLVKLDRKLTLPRRQDALVVRLFPPNTAPRAPPSA